MTLTLHYLPPAVLSPNSRGHWAPKAKAAKKLREDAYYAAKTQLPGVCFQQVRATVQWRVSDPKRRRDLDNAAASMKAFWDGLTDAGLWPDDSAAHLTIVWAEPPFLAVKTVKEEGINVTLTGTEVV